MRNIRTKKIGHQKSLEIELSEFYYRYLPAAASLLVDGKLPSAMPGDGYTGEGSRKIGDFDWQETEIDPRFCKISKKNFQPFFLKVLIK